MVCTILGCRWNILLHLVRHYWCIYWCILLFWALKSLQTYFCICKLWPQKCSDRFGFLVSFIPWCPGMIFTKLHMKNFPAIDVCGAHTMEYIFSRHKKWDFPTLAVMYDKNLRQYSKLPEKEKCLITYYRSNVWLSMSLQHKSKVWGYLENYHPIIALCLGFSSNMCFHPLL